MYPQSVPTYEASCVSAGPSPDTSSGKGSRDFPGPTPENCEHQNVGEGVHSVSAQERSLEAHEEPGASKKLSIQEQF